MKNKFIAAITIGVLVFCTFASAKPVVRDSKAKKAQAIQLVALLPATDGILTIDVRKFFDVALPKLLSGNQTILKGVLEDIDSMKAKTGIDIRQFETLAAGFTAKQIKDKEFDIDTVVVARGQINSGALLAAAKLASNGKYREEKAGDKTIFIFAAKEIADQNAPKTANSGKLLGHMDAEIGAAAIDNNTLVFGKVPIVKLALESRTKPLPEFTGFLNRKPAAVANFAAKLPAGVKQLLPTDNDELGKNIDSIRYLFGSVDVLGDNAVLNLTAKTAEAVQAQGLLDTIDVLKALGKLAVSGSKKPENQALGRLIETAQFSVKGNELSLDLKIPQSDLDLLTSMIK